MAVRPLILGHRKCAAVERAVCQHYWQPCILFIGLKEGNVVEMDKNHVMAAVTPLSMLHKKATRLLFLRKILATRV